MESPENFPEISEETKRKTFVAITSEDDIDIFNLIWREAEKSEFQDLVAKITYSEYVIQKHKYIQQCKKEEGQLPSDEEMDTFIDVFKGSDLLNSLMKGVESSLIQFIIQESAIEVIKSTYSLPSPRIPKRLSYRYV
jgi:hypothetical protein